MGRIFFAQNFKYYYMAEMKDQDKLKMLLTCIDLTSLEATDNEESILNLVRKANEGFEGMHVAAVCVFPNFGDLVRKTLVHSINTAVVAGYFPSGQTFTETKINELKLIEQSTIEEVDIVIHRGEFLAGNFDFVKNEIQLMRDAVPSKILKVILETGELKTSANIKKASEIAIECGADFIKTSTGKGAAGADAAAVEIMCSVISNHYNMTGKKIGIKPSGGIREIDDALKYMDLVRKILGDEWMTNKLFRIGASSLYSAIISDLSKNK